MVDLFGNRFLPNTFRCSYDTCLFLKLVFSFGSSGHAFGLSRGIAVRTHFSGCNFFVCFSLRFVTSIFQYSRATVIRTYYVSLGYLTILVFLRSSQACLGFPWFPLAFQGACILWARPYGGSLIVPATQKSRGSETFAVFEHLRADSQ